MSGRIIISELIVHAVIGVYAFEQSITQPLTIDLSFDVDIARAASQDNLADTHDYAAICAAVSVFAENNAFRLIETFAARLSDYLTQQYSLKNLELSVMKKPKDLPNVAGVRVFLTYVKN